MSCTLFRLSLSPLSADASPQADSLIETIVCGAMAVHQMKANVTEYSDIRRRVKAVDQ